jgi:8-oxo-dGTP pyrophosphatase MutT (NUDIX family)
MIKIKYSGKIIEVIEEQHGSKIFEIARRSPGVRALIVKDNKILLSREYRSEIDGYDFRLPGGKVFDKFEEYKKHISEDLLMYAENAVIKEVYEEVGLVSKNPKFIKVSKAGATINWDLYYFEITDFIQEKQHLEEGEDITFEWYSIQKDLKLISENKMSEDRSVGVLFNYIVQNFRTQLKEFCDKELT